MNTRTHPTVTLFGALTACALFPFTPLHAANEPRFVPNVIAQFNALTERPDPLGFHIGSSPNPSTCRHYQGMVRLQGEDGTPYFIVSRSGVRPNLLCTDPGDDDNQPGNLIIVRMDSRDKFGERMRSNRLRPDRDLTSTPPDIRDTTVAHITFNGETWPNYGHPGGMQLFGDVLAVAMESPYDDGLPESAILFIDVSDPEHPSHIRLVDVGAGVKTGFVGLTQLGDGRFVMVMSGKDNELLWFFETTGPDATNLRNPSLQWNLVSVWDPAVMVGGEWPTGSGGYQTFQFLRQGDINGPLYLAGARGLFAIGEDWMDLYEVEKVDGDYLLYPASRRHMNSHPNADASVLSPGNNTANFAASSTFYVSPSGELIFYATEHDNDGWIDTPTGPFPSGSVKAGEWRHYNMVRPGSPTLRPHLTLFPPYEVAEGGTTVLTGFARPPLTRPWIQLYADSNFEGRYVVIDFADWEKDSFDNFKDLDGSLLDLHAGFSDETSSWRWFAPEFCTIRANDDDFGDGSFPGNYTRTLHGTGLPESDANLSSVLNNAGTGNMNDELTSAEFFADCDEYYSTFPELFWDTDRNGGYETVGYVAPFDATNLDGPSEASARVLAIHPIDGLTTEGAAIVQVFNVAPTITTLRVFDSRGREVGVEVPFVLRKLPVTLRATFTDPGKPDHQTASLAWGHGAPEANPRFVSFSDAFGGATGNVVHRHSYSSPGAYPIKLSVQDDDGGTGHRDLALRVLTPAQAVDEIITLLDGIIAHTADRGQRIALALARRTLAGHASGRGRDGALDFLLRGKTLAALVAVKVAIVELHLARLFGADVDELCDLLRQVELSIIAN